MPYLFIQYFSASYDWTITILHSLTLNRSHRACKIWAVYLCKRLILKHIWVKDCSDLMFITLKIETKTAETNGISTVCYECSRIFSLFASYLLSILWLAALSCIYLACPAENRAHECREYQQSMHNSVWLHTHVCLSVCFSSWQPAWSWSPRWGFWAGPWSSSAAGSSVWVSVIKMEINIFSYWDEND